jgi:hypothetical protein
LTKLTFRLGIPVVSTESSVEGRVDNVLDSGIDRRLDGIFGLLNLPGLGGVGIVAVVEVDGPD